MTLVPIRDDPPSEISRQTTIAHAVLGRWAGDRLVSTALALRWPLGSLFAVGWFLAHKGIASSSAGATSVGSFFLMAPLALLCALTGNAGLAALELRRQVTLLHLHLFLLALYLPAAAAAVSFDLRTLPLCAVALCSAVLLLLDTVSKKGTLPRFHHLTVAVASVELIVWFDVVLHLEAASPPEEPSLQLGPHHTVRPLEFVHGRTTELCLLSVFALLHRWRAPHALVYTAFLATTGAGPAERVERRANMRPPAPTLRRAGPRGPASVAGRVPQPLQASLQAALPRALSEHGVGAGAAPEQAGEDRVAVGHLDAASALWTGRGGSGFSADLPAPWALRSETSSTTDAFAGAASDGPSGAEEDGGRLTAAAEEMRLQQVNYGAPLHESHAMRGPAQRAVGKAVGRMVDPATAAYGAVTGSRGGEGCVSLDSRSAIPSTDSATSATSSGGAMTQEVALGGGPPRSNLPALSPSNRLGGGGGGRWVAAHSHGVGAAPRLWEGRQDSGPVSSAPNVHAGAGEPPASRGSTESAHTETAAAERGSLVARSTRARRRSVEGRVAAMSGHPAAGGSRFTARSIFADLTSSVQGPDVYTREGTGPHGPARDGDPPQSQAAGPGDRARAPSSSSRPLPALPRHIAAARGAESPRSAPQLPVEPAVSPRERRGLRLGALSPQHRLPTESLPGPDDAGASAGKEEEVTTARDLLPSGSISLDTRPAESRSRLSAQGRGDSRLQPAGPNSQGGLSHAAPGLDDSLPTPPDDRAPRAANLHAACMDAEEWAGDTQDNSGGEPGGPEGPEALLPAVTSGSSGATRASSGSALSVEGTS